MQCPTTAAKIIVDKGRITIGWVAARVEVLRARPMTCYRCKRRHTARNCTSEHDRSNQCYNCGGEGHQAKTCSAPSSCPVCSAAGKPANHCFEGKACDLPSNRRTGKGKEPTAEKTRPQRTNEATTVGTSDKASDNQIAKASGQEEAMETTE